MYVDDRRLEIVNDLLSLSLSFFFLFFTIIICVFQREESRERVIMTIGHTQRRVTKFLRSFL